ncbi:hypothetical protein JHK85_010024 [Glycine max]|nr:hypothetical protein JHK85_010024 [Glycine max]
MNQQKDKGGYMQRQTAQVNLGPGGPAPNESCGLRVPSYLNTNHDLYDAVKKAEQECHMLSEEAQRGVRNLRADFERGGIHLCPDKEQGLSNGSSNCLFGLTGYA